MFRVRPESGERFGIVDHSDPAGQPRGRIGIGNAHLERGPVERIRKRAEHECINAGARRMGLTQLTVRGKLKARAALLLIALAHNMLRSFALRRAAEAAA